MEAKQRSSTSARGRSKSPASRKPKTKSPTTEAEVKPKKVKGTTPKKKQTTAAVVNGDPLSAEARRISDQNAKMSLAAGIIVPWLVSPLFGIKLDGFVESFHFGLPWIPSDPSRLLALIAVLSTPHVFYAWTWTHADQWAAICHKRCLEPYKAFAMTAHFIKAFQFLGMFLWAYSLISDPISLIKHIHPLKAVLMLQLFGIGQILNVQVYQKIGEAGVYYGTRLGIDVPWVYGFPFSVVPHPQYFGATLSFWAMFLLMQNETTVQNGVYILCIVMAAFYAFSSWVEANL